MSTPASEPPYRVPPPGPGARIAWPADFGTRFLVCVDTEEEFDWSVAPSRANRRVSATAAIPEGHGRFAQRGVPLTFLVDHPIVDDARSVDVLRDVLADGVSAVGTQLHAWVNPPFLEAETPANTFAGNLPRDLEAAKLDVLTDAITTAFGTRPLIYRAGRYGIGPNTAALLTARGYRLDSSMRAAYDYSGDHGPDFSAIGNHAFHLAAGLVELPLTTVFTGGARRGGAGLYRALGRVPKGRGIFARARLLSRVALTPEDMPLAEAQEAVRIALGEGVALLNFAFHSPSLVPGHTPYVRDSADLARFWAWWDGMLTLLEARGVRPASLDHIIAAL